MSRCITEFPCEYDCSRRFWSCTFLICQLQPSLAAAFPPHFLQSRSTPLRRDFHLITQEAPGVFQDIKARLPLMIDIMTRIKKRCGDGSMPIDAQHALSDAVEGCLKQIALLDRLVEKMLPTSTDSPLRRARK